MPTTIPQQLTELQRELETRQRVYPDWVKAGRLSQATADHRQQVLVDLIATLDAVSTLVEMVTNSPEPNQLQPVQAALFIPEQAPTINQRSASAKPQRGLYADH